MRLQATIPAVLLFLAIAILPALAAAQDNKEKPEPLDLNTATVEQLEKLPGVGPSIAKSIVRFREKSGPFRRVEDLLAIRGITKKRLETLRPLVTVKPPVAMLVADPKDLPELAT